MGVDIGSLAATPLLIKAIDGNKFSKAFTGVAIAELIRLVVAPAPSLTGLSQCTGILMPRFDHLNRWQAWDGARRKPFIDALTGHPVRRTRPTDDLG